MSRKEIIQVRTQVCNAMHDAVCEKVTYSPLLRKVWQTHGYVPVGARNAA